MKKLALFLLGITFFLVSCGSDYSIKYDGPNVINIVLMEDLSLNIESDEPLTYHSDNELYVEVSSDGVIHGKNIGEANITVSNAENEITLHVVVSLFEEPTLDFGCNRDKILSLYGTPTIYTDSVIVYTNWYSYAVWSMSFFFENNSYYESDLYIRNDLDMRIDEYLNNNFHYQGKFYDQNNNEVYTYLNDSDKSKANVFIGKQYNANKDGDICLMYVPYRYEENRDEVVFRRQR